MYPEFIAIYIGLALVLVLLIVVLILQIAILRGGGRSSGPKRSANAAKGSVVFCKTCAARFSSSERVCPKCGAPR